VRKNQARVKRQICVMSFTVVMQNANLHHRSAMSATSGTWFHAHALSLFKICGAKVTCRQCSFVLYIAQNVTSTLLIPAILFSSPCFICMLTCSITKHIAASSTRFQIPTASFRTTLIPSSFAVHPSNSLFCFYLHSYLHLPMNVLIHTHNSKLP
jgi:hypothetical protein